MRRCVPSLRSSLLHGRMAAQDDMHCLAGCAPDCQPADTASWVLQSWIGNVAPYVRGLTNSLLTVGSEGFYQASNCQAN